MLDAGAVRRWVPALLRRLESDDIPEVLATGWLLVALGVKEAVGPLERFRDRHPATKYPHNVASVQVLALSQPDEVPRRMTAHDHEHMAWLAYAASLIRSTDASITLEECARNASDQDCRAACARFAPSAGAGSDVPPRGLSEHQQRVLARIADEVAAYRAGTKSIRALLTDVWGLYQAAELPAGEARDRFLDLYSRLTSAADARQPWMPPGLGTADDVEAAVRELEGWALAVRSRRGD